MSANTQIDSALSSFVRSHDTSNDSIHHLETVVDDMQLLLHVGALRHSAVIEIRDPKHRQRSGVHDQHTRSLHRPVVHSDVHVRSS